MSIIILLLGFPDGLAGKGSTWKARDLSSKSGLEKSPGEENSYPLQYSGLENSMRLQRVGHAATAAKSLQSCPALCNPVDGSPPGSPISGILQARTLEWVAISFSNAWKGEVKVKLLSHVQLLATPWTVAHQAPPSMGFSRQEYCSGMPSPSLNLISYTNIFKILYVIHCY